MICQVFVSSLRSSRLCGLITRPPSKLVPPACRKRGLLIHLLALSLLALPPSLLAAQHHVSSAADISRATAALRPGDELILSNGVWQDQVILFQAQGTPEKPITLRAESPGKLELRGRSSLTVTGEYLVVSSLCFADGGGVTDGILVSGQHCRLTDTAVKGGTYKFFVHLAGAENRMDHCYLAGKTSESPTLQVEVGAKPNHHRIDHNHFGPRPPLGRNGGETMRVGYSWQSMSNSATLVEQNLFDRCDGELEIISSKSCENIYRDNTFLDCAGMLTLRHGNRCVVENNYFVAHRKRGSGGIRVIGDDHVIVNNYLDGVYQGGIWVTAGISNSPLKGYFQARNATIANNTFVDCRGACIDVSAGFGTSERTLRPENITIASNLFALPSDGSLIKGTEGKGFRWNGNLAAHLTSAPAVGSSETNPHPGVELVDAKLYRGKDNLWHPEAESPVNTVNAATSGALPIGGDLCARQASRRPLTAAEVGPAWLKPESR
jgi:poly(beta-D-mannuronate) lyase